MRQYNPDTDCIVIVDNHHGRYIPSEFCTRYEEQLEKAGFGIEAFSVILTAATDDPDADWQDHDDSWQIIMDNYLHKYAGRE